MILSQARPVPKPAEPWSYRIPGDSASAGFDGNHGRVSLRTGLRVHYCEGADRYDRAAEAELDPGLTLYLFLTGRPDAKLGGRPLLPDDSGAGPCAVLVSRTQAEVLERRGRKGHYACKLATTVTPDWLADCGMEFKGNGLDIAAFAASHLSQKVWTPNRAVCAAAEQVLRAMPANDPFGRLQLESRVIDLLAEAFRGLVDTPAPVDPSRLRLCDLQRVRRVEDFVESAEAGALSLKGLAACAGVSVSTLQRLFQTVHGMSPVEYIRRQALEKARAALRYEGISVKEAAFRAGYSSAANFSTAFRRQYGHPPTAGA